MATNGWECLLVPRSSLPQARLAVDERQRNDELALGFALSAKGG
jgi:hypothetical protein